MHDQGPSRSKLLLLAGLAAYCALALTAQLHNTQNDLAIYRAGASIALTGRSPYDSGLIQEEVGRLLPDEGSGVALNCGFFLPPEAIAIFAPLALMSWHAAELCWFLTLTAFGLACGKLAWTFARDQAHRGSGWAIIVVALLLNPVTQLALVVGQTSLLFAGSIALGQYCFERGLPSLGSLLWALTFIKPHLAIPFLLLAWALGGWRRPIGIVFFVALLNLFGGLLTRGSVAGAVDLFTEYLSYVGSGHKQVIFNLVAENFQILSWNRVVAAAGGPAIDLSIGTILTGFALWGLLVLGRLRWSTQWNLSPDWLLAVTATGALFFAQVLAYELILLVLLVPLIAQDFDSGRRADAWFVIAMLLYLMIPIDLTERLGELIALDESSRGRTLLRSHKCFGMALLATYLIVRGPRIKR
jgi:hypothetical protein